jgi:hypothetical protein
MVVAVCVWCAGLKMRIMMIFVVEQIEYDFGDKKK